jgi:hypothetical protein
MNLRLVTLAAACAMLTSVPVAAQSTFTSFSGTETILPPGSPFPPAEGVVKCQGGAPPTGNFYIPCGIDVPGSIRGRVVYALESTTIPALQGLARIVVNVNFDRDGQGPMWGTFELAVADGGTVEGSYTGHVDLASSTMRLKVVGHGDGGAVDGVQVMFDDVHQGSPFGTLQGRVLDPGGAR